MLVFRATTLVWGRGRPAEELAAPKVPAAPRPSLELSFVEAVVVPSARRRVTPVVAAVVRAAPAAAAPASPAGARGGVLSALRAVRLLLSLVVLLALHPAVLEPDLDLPLGQVEVPRQLPPLLLRGAVDIEWKIRPCH